MVSVQNVIANFLSAKPLNLFGLRSDRQVGSAFPARDPDGQWVAHSARVVNKV
jgi:hypothetical protein